MININDLPNPISRLDKYKNYMCQKVAGNAPSLSDLPEPVSRADKYNMYLCENIGTSGTGGGSGGVANAFTSIEQTESVINFKSDNTTKATLEIITDEDIDAIISGLN